MRLILLVTGKLKESPERALVDDYLLRARPMARVIGFRSLDEIEVASGGGLDAEAERLLGKLPAGGNAIRLDEHGDALSSTDFSRRLAHLRDSGTPSLTFLIGGAEGYGEAIEKAVPQTLAFGPQTWPHRLVRVMLAEQIYRAVSILSGTPYHKA